MRGESGEKWKGLHMSNLDTGAEDGPQRGAKESRTGPGATKRKGGRREAHCWVVAWEEPLGRMWVCADCGATRERRYG